MPRRLLSLQLLLQRDDWWLLPVGSAGWIHFLLLLFHFFMPWMILLGQGTVIRTAGWAQGWGYWQPSNAVMLGNT